MNPTILPPPPLQRKNKRLQNRKSLEKVTEMNEAQSVQSRIGCVNPTWGLLQQMIHLFTVCLKTDQHVYHQINLIKTTRISQFPKKHIYDRRSFIIKVSPSFFHFQPPELVDQPFL